MMKQVSTSVARRAHDYLLLVRRWRAVARRHGLVMRKFGEEAGYSLYYLFPRARRLSGADIYLSAGIHGDEPASSEGLIHWAESDGASLLTHNFLIFPCLNPWGLVNNVRTDSQQRDLNRSYHLQEVMQTVAHLNILKGRRFDGALSLHEDYDAEGLYLYEIRGPLPTWGEAIRDAASAFVRVDERTKIEGRKSEKGIVRRRFNGLTMPLRPEALHLFIEHSCRVITFETPSEFAIEDRVAAQTAAIQAFVKLVETEYPRRAGVESRLFARSKSSKMSQ